MRRQNARAMKERSSAATDRGSVEGPDFTPGCPGIEAPQERHAEAWESQPLMDEQRRNNLAVIPPPSRPRVIFRYADAKDLLISGLKRSPVPAAQITYDWHWPS